MTDTFKYRPHRGALADAMKEVREFKSFDELLDHVIKELNFFEHDFVIDHTTVHVEKYCYDERIEWDTYIVTLDGFGVLGMTDGAVEKYVCHECGEALAHLQDYNLHFDRWGMCYAAKKEDAVE